MKLSKGYRILALVGGMAILSAVALPRLNADERDKKVVVTFSQPVEIPGNRVLAAGTYAFREAPGEPGVIIITSEDLKTPYGMVFAQATSFWTSNPEVKFHFGEAKAGQPRMLKSWTYPGIGSSEFEFAVPEGRTK